MSRLTRLFRSTTAPTKFKTRSTSRPMLDILEGRTLMAGNITATISPASVLTLREVKGQTGQNHAVEINQLADGTLHVEGIATADGTKSLINGAPFIDVHGVQFLNVFFGSGSDFVEVGNHGPIALKNVTIGVGSFNATSPGPRDAVDVQNLTGNVLAISTGGGDDSVLVRNANLNGNVDISTGSGNNALSVVGTNVRNLSALMGKGLNGVIMENVNAKLNLGVTTGLPGGSASNDVIILSHVNAGDSLSINTNGGSDTVRLSNVSAARNLNVNLGAGNDSLSLVHVRADNINVNGGTGFDHLAKIDVDFGTHMKMAGFEAISNFQIDPGLLDNPPILVLAN